MGLGGGIDPAVGNPAPGFRLLGGGRKTVRLKLSAGTRTVYVDLLQTQSVRARPKFRVLANPAIGVPGDIVVSASASVGWVTMNSGPLTVTAAGGLHIELINPDPRADAPAYFDNIQIL